MMEKIRSYLWTLEVGNQQGWDVKYKKKRQVKQGLSGGEKVEGRALGIDVD